MHQDWKMHIFFTFLFKKKKSFCSFHVAENTLIYSCVCTNAENRGKLCWLLKYSEDKCLNGD